MTAAVPGPGELIGGKYRVESVLGQGGMGAVLRAQNVATERWVAIKWLLPSLGPSADASARFLREARAMGRVDHPNVVGVLDVGEHDDAVFLVMELLHGSSLRALLERGVAMSPSRVLELIVPALSGIEAAHRAGVVHRDLKPDNLFVCTDDDGQPSGIKVLDFGISKLRDTERQAEPSSITRTGATVGTPHYMSSEQVRGLKDIDLRTDVYSVGVILYEMLTGQVPFDAESYGGLLVAIATATPRSPSDLVPDLPAGLGDVVLKAIGRAPEDRWATIQDLATALAPFTPGHVRFRAPRRPPPSPDSTGPIRAAGGASAGLPTRPGPTADSSETGALHLSIAVEAPRTPDAALAVTAHAPASTRASSSTGAPTRRERSVRPPTPTPRAPRSAVGVLAVLATIGLALLAWAFSRSEAPAARASARVDPSPTTVVAPRVEPSVRSTLSAATTAPPVPAAVAVDAPAVAPAGEPRVRVGAATESDARARPRRAARTTVTSETSTMPDSPTTGSSTASPTTAGTPRVTAVGRTGALRSEEF